MTRRRWLVASTAVAAASAGVGWNIWRNRDDGVGALWEMRFPQPGGGELVMASLKGRPLLINFWATWCAPCVKEMPELDRFQREFSNRGWQVAGLAVDEMAPVQEFLRRAPVSFAIGMTGFDGADLSRQLGNTQGALPFSAMLDRDGRIVKRKLGQTSYAELVDWAGPI